MAIKISSTTVIDDSRNLANIAGGTITGNLIVGQLTNVNGSRFVANGVIETTTGGVRFPDGTIQTTASVGGGGTITSVVQTVGATVTTSGNVVTVGGSAFEAF